MVCVWWGGVCGVWVFAGGLGGVCGCVCLVCGKGVCAGCGYGSACARSTN